MLVARAEHRSDHLAGRAATEERETMSAAAILFFMLYAGLFGYCWGRHDGEKAERARVTGIIARELLKAEDEHEHETT